MMKEKNIFTSQPHPLIMSFDKKNSVKICFVNFNAKISN